MLETVSVPEQFEPLFQKAQEYVHNFFQQKEDDPSKGTIELFGQRYILVRAASMSVDFFETIKGLYQDFGDEEAIMVTRSLLFDIAHAIGKMDARNFHVQMKVEDPIEKLSAGPIHFAYSGWAYVEIHPDSRPSPDENFYLIYDHPFSFESDAWLSANKKSDFPVCVMNAGYSSGWCEESFDIKLTATEIMCKAKGDEACRFIMAPPSRIEAHIQEYINTTEGMARKITEYQIPGFFEVQQMKEKLKKSEARFRDITLSMADWIWEVNAKGEYTYCSQSVQDILGYELEDILGRTPFHFMPEDEADRLGALFEGIVRDKAPIKDLENWNLTRDGERICLITNGVPIIDQNGELVGYRGVDKDITERKQAEEELDRKVRELEQFNKLAIDRELKMIELKEEIQRLKLKLDGVDK